jgi:repressor LexA
MNHPEELTRKQQAVYDFLRRRAQNGARAPTLDELCGEMGLRSRGSMHKHIQALVQAGLVEPTDRRRGIRLSDSGTGGDDVLPLVGRIAAGRPIEALEQADRIQVPETLRTRRPCFVLQVRGDSMIGAGILDGDFVVVEQRDHANDGEIVVALIDNEEATLKRIEQRPGQVLLHPDNPALSPMVYDPGQVRIQGVVVGQMRAYR